jgi:hypothetical protein
VTYRANQFHDGISTPIQGACDDSAGPEGVVVDEQDSVSICKVCEG